MEKTALSSFEIHGFRAFEHLKLEKLGRVNLFTGKNNVGKTSLLEALWVYANQGAPAILWSILESRNEGSPLPEFQFSEEDLSAQIEAVLSLFSGRKTANENIQPIEIGPTSDPDKLVSIKFTWSKNLRMEKTDDNSTSQEILPALNIQVGKIGSPYRLDRSLRNRMAHDKMLVKKPFLNIFIPASGIPGETLEKYWDAITLSPLENDVINTLKILEPGLERISMVAASKTSHRRTSIVKTSRHERPVPMRSLGEGMNRIFGLALAMVNAKDGMLLIDEIESGLHYSILPEMWRFIFQAAQRLNVQVFATTHSWDCITGFQQAAQESDQDGMMIRLVNKKGKIVPTFFDEKDLSIATREQIEVR